MRRASLPPSTLLAAGRAQGQRLEAGHVLPRAGSELFACTLLLQENASRRAEPSPSQGKEELQGSCCPSTGHKQL